ncbi:hypothetical protein [Aquiflexum sp.]|uniref:hypothetical protein n=1 Tax=Aquiflexum sp. TaxID=1872584 RepID=UPI0035934F3E
MAKAKLRSINTAIWFDPWFFDLSPNKKLVWLYLLTNESTNMLGAYQITIVRIAFETGLSEKIISEILSDFQSDRKIIFQDHFIIIINWVKNQSYNSNMLINVDAILNDLKPSLRELMPKEIIKYINWLKEKQNKRK